MAVSKDIAIEELVKNYPRSVGFLMEKGIKCFVCGEPLWGTLESSAREKGMSDRQIDRIVDELNELLEEDE